MDGLSCTQHLLKDLNFILPWSNSIFNFLPWHGWVKLTFPPKSPPLIYFCTLEKHHHPTGWSGKKLWLVYDSSLSPSLLLTHEHKHTHPQKPIFVLYNIVKLPTFIKILIYTRHVHLDYYSLFLSGIPESHCSPLIFIQNYAMKIVYFSCHSVLSYYLSENSYTGFRSIPQSSTNFHPYLQNSPYPSCPLYLSIFISWYVCACYLHSTFCTFHLVFLYNLILHFSFKDSHL